MPEPEITVRKLVGLQQLSRWPCPDCEQPAWTDHHGDVAGHLDPVHDRLCPELARREQAKEDLRNRLQAVYEMIGDAPLRPDPPPVFTTRARAEAYEAWKREHDVTAWSQELRNATRRALDEHARKLEQMLGALPIGYRLCVHVPEWRAVPGELGVEHVDVVMMRMRQKAHMLGPDEQCLAVPSERVEYGPRR